MLSAAEQERYARHLLLDQLGGEGQERLAAATALVQLPGPAAQAALWATRYLAASGLGALQLEGPWARSAADECAFFWPGTRVRVGSATPPEGTLRVSEQASSPSDVTIAGRDLAPAAAAALGAWAALEVVKRIAGAGRRASLPLRFAAPP